VTCSADSSTNTIDELHERIYVPHRRNRGSLQPGQVGQNHDALLVEDLVVEEAMAAGEREDHRLILCATHDGECRARGRGIGA
jgi:hypothetical protein